MKLEPLGDRVLIRRDQKESTYHGIIHLPDNRTEKPQLGTVVAVGEGRRGDDGKNEGCLVAPGERVMFGKYSGTDLKLGEDEFVVIREQDIIGVVHNEEEKPS